MQVSYQQKEREICKARFFCHVMQIIPSVAAPFGGNFQEQRGGLDPSVQVMYQSVNAEQDHGKQGKINVCELSKFE